MRKKISIFYQNHKVFSFYFVYSILFFLMFELCYGMYFQMSHKTYMWGVDGFEITYPQFIYAGKWLRSVFKNIFVKHTFSLPMWDMSLGFGLDTIATNANSYLTLTDPFFIIAAIFPARYSEFGFCLLLILKIYFAGLAFCFYARERKIKNMYVLSGAMVYVFSSSMYIVFRQSTFPNQFILFPLVMLGIERIFEGKKPHLYIASLAISMAISFYYTYMFAILIIGYFLIRYIVELKTRSFKEWCSLTLKFGIYSFFSCGWGALITLPTIKLVLSISRLDLEHYLPLFYNKKYNASILTGFITAFDGGSDWVIGFSVIAVICALLVLVEKKMITEKIILIVLTISLFVPYVGHIFNGFNYATNRWIFGYAFFVSYLVCIMLERIQKLNGKRLLIALAVFVLYGFVLIFVLIFGFKVYDALIILILFFGICFFVFASLSKNIKEQIYSKLVLAFVLFSCLLPSYYWFALEKNNLPSIEVDRGKAFERLTENGGKPALDDIDKEQLTRCEIGATGKSRNSTWIYGISAMDYYYSCYLDSIDKFLKSMGVANVGSANTIAGLDRRGALEKLLGVNYYLAKEGEIVPIGFDVIKSVYVSDEGESYNLWTRSNKADMMYAFDYVVDYDTYNNNDAYGKQELVMNAVVLEGDDLDSVNMPQYLSENNKNEDVVNYEIVEKEGLTIDDKKIEVYSNNAYLTIKTNDEINNSELLVLIDNIVNYNMDVSAFIVDISAFNENDEWISGRSLNIWTTRDHMYKGQDSWLFNLGAINQPTYKIRISFNTPGMYSYDGIKIFAEPLEKEYNLMNQLTLCVDGDILVDNNKVKAKVNLEDDSIVFVSIPYMEGWKAKIDGKETKVYKADEAFIALKVPAGVHEVEMEYKTRFIEISIIAGILLWIYILGLCVKKRREQKI